MKSALFANAYSYFYFYFFCKDKKVKAIDAAKSAIR